METFQAVLVLIKRPLTQTDKYDLQIH